MKFSVQRNHCKISQQEGLLPQPDPDYEQSVLISTIVFSFVFYAFFSFVEWAVHRHLMHSASEYGGQAIRELFKRHMTHHQLTREDMRLDTTNTNRNLARARFDDFLQFQGLYFLWPATIAVAIISTIGALALARLLNVDAGIALSMALVMTLFQSAMWNAFHPDMHQVDRRLRITEGFDVIPRQWLRARGIYRWYRRNHVAHHLSGGTRNFNVTLPLTDQILALPFIHGMLNR